MTRTTRSGDAEAQYRALVQHAPVGLAIVNRDGRLLLVNPATCQLVGYDADRLLQQSVLQLFHTDDHDRLAALLADCANRPGEPRVTHARALRADGTTLDIELTAVNRLDDATVQGLILSLRDVTRDLTEHRRLEGQFLQAQKMEPLGRLAGGIAHDFNNLLTAIGGYTEFLAEEFSESDPRMREVEEIRKATERAAALTRQLLAFSRKQALKLTAIDLNAVVGNMDRMLRRLIGEDVSLKTVLAPNLEPAHADAGQIEQVIVNLAVNARDAMPRGGHLRLETANVALRPEDVARQADVEPGSYVMLAVSDTGVGMSAETRAHLFEPFFTTKERGRGTGLGLSTVYGIVKQCGGHITVTSEVDHGTTFRVYLPQASTQALVAIGLPVEISGGSETILVVEDDPSVLRLTREALERRGYRVLTASGWLEALDLVSRKTIDMDLVLTDVVMPGMGGRMLGERIRLIRPEVKLLYMSGYPEGALDQQGNRRPGVELLEKPFTADRLALKVRQALDQRS